jgi:hypothetical protein
MKLKDKSELIRSYGWYMGRKNAYEVREGNWANWEQAQVRFRLLAQKTSTEDQLDTAETQPAQSFMGVADDVIGAVDDVARAVDDVLGAADDIVGAADDIVGAADDIVGAADDVVGVAEAQSLV